VLGLESVLQSVLGLVALVSAQVLVLVSAALVLVSGEGLALALALVSGEL